MFQLRPSKDRGYFDHGWLKTFHTFSFADYYDPNYMGFGSLRVINEDFIQGGYGFPTHGHQNMEIITYPIDGAVAHKDSTGSSGVIYPFEVQRMTAGRGIRHSEYNHYPDKILHLLQIWLIPNQQNLPPSYEQKSFKKEISSPSCTLIASPTGESGSCTINQDTFIWVYKLSRNQPWSRDLNPQRKYWVQVVRGSANCLSIDQELFQGDGLAISAETNLKLISDSDDSEFLVFDMR